MGQRAPRNVPQDVYAHNVYKKTANAHLDNVKMATTGISVVLSAISTVIVVYHVLPIVRSVIVQAIVSNVCRDITVKHVQISVRRDVDSQLAIF